MNEKLRNMTSIYLTCGNDFLCLYRIGSRVADRMYIGSAGGHFESEELNDPQKCVLRELEEELGLRETDISGLSMRYVTLRLKNGEIRQNYYFFGSLQERRPLQSTEGELHWIRAEDIPALRMPASAKQMILHYLRVGRYDAKLYAAVTRESGTEFVPLTEFEDPKTV